jgi:hypothetical protein
MPERIDRDRLSVITGALVLALALARLVDVPGRPFEVTVLGSPLGITLSENSIMLLTIVGMTVTGAESLIRSHPLARQGEVGRSLLYWIIPGTLGAALTSWLGTIDDLGLWTLALFASALLIPLAMAAEYAMVSPRARNDVRLYWGQMALAHVVALILFTVIYGARVRGLLSGPAVFVVTALLATRLFWAAGETVTKALVYGAAAGLVLAEMIWVLNYLPLSELRGGLILFILFYVFVGIIQQYLAGRFGRRILLEYAGVALLSLTVVVAAVR